MLVPFQLGSPMQQCGFLPVLARLQFHPRIPPGLVSSLFWTQLPPRWATLHFPLLNFSRLSNYVAIPCLKFGSWRSKSAFLAPKPISQLPPFFAHIHHKYHKPAKLLVSAMLIPRVLGSFIFCCIPFLCFSGAAPSDPQFLNLIISEEPPLL